jgi:Asp-tRNA(Asn)/Glu-tRNA(Gln) amidotransferase C subunit
MRRMSAESVADLCPELFGVEFDRERLDVLLTELTGILSEVEKLRQLDLSDVPPVVVFDPAAGYEEVGHD